MTAPPIPIVHPCLRSDVWQGRAPTKKTRRLCNSSILFCNRYGCVYDLAVRNLKNIVNGIHSRSVKALLIEN